MSLLTIWHPLWYGDIWLNDNKSCRMTSRRKQLVIKGTCSNGSDISNVIEGANDIDFWEVLTLNWRFWNH